MSTCFKIILPLDHLNINITTSHPVPKNTIAIVSSRGIQIGKFYMITPTQINISDENMLPYDPSIPLQVNIVYNNVNKNVLEQTFPSVIANVIAEYSLPHLTIITSR